MVGSRRSCHRFLHAFSCELIVPITALPPLHAAPSPLAHPIPTPSPPPWPRRSYIHYRDEVFCAAGRIIAAMETEAGPGGYKALHIRRGDLQFKEVKIPAEKIIANTKDILKENETIYIATDETDEAYLDVFRKRFNVFFLKDFHERVGLPKLNQNYMGMLEQIVCSRSQVFIGTWFSTFTGYITRMRGYYGFDYRTNWYHFGLRKDSFQTEYHPRDPWYVREWPEGWVNIDE